jgi:hypothetical protein
MVVSFTRRRLQIHQKYYLYLEYSIRVNCKALQYNMTQGTEECHLRYFTRSNEVSENQLQACICNLQFSRSFLCAKVHEGISWK